MIEQNRLKQNCSNSSQLLSCSLLSCPNSPKTNAYTGPKTHPSQGRSKPRRMQPTRTKTHPKQTPIQALKPIPAEAEANQGGCSLQGLNPASVPAATNTKPTPLTEFLCLVTLLLLQSVYVKGSYLFFCLFGFSAKLSHFNPLIVQLSTSNENERLFLSLCVCYKLSSTFVCYSYDKIKISLQEKYLLLSAI